jgi:hypothetical protein
MTWRCRLTHMRLAMNISVVAALVAAVLWAATALLGMKPISLTRDTKLQMSRGVVDLQHTYARDIGPKVSVMQWRMGMYMLGGENTDPPKLGWFPKYSFTDGHISATVPFEGPATFNRYWALRIPIWLGMLPGIAATAWRIGAWNRQRRLNVPGFPVVPLKKASGIEAALRGVDRNPAKPRRNTSIPR